MKEYLGQYDNIPFKDFSIDELLQRVKRKDIMLLQLGVEGEIKRSIDEADKTFQLELGATILFNTFDHYVKAPQKNVYVRLDLHSEGRKPLCTTTYDWLTQSQSYGVMLQYALPTLLREINEALTEIPHFQRYKDQELYRTRGPPS